MCSSNKVVITAAKVAVLQEFITIMGVNVISENPCYNLVYPLIQMSYHHSTKWPPSSLISPHVHEYSTQGHEIQSVTIHTSINIKADNNWGQLCACFQHGDAIPSTDSSLIWNSTLMINGRNTSVNGVLIWQVKGHWRLNH